MAVEIAPLTADRLDEVARVHRLAFPEGALTALGPEAVRRYYEWQLVGPHDVVALAATGVEAGLIGFAVGGVFRGALSGFLGANRGFLVRTLASHPWLAGRAVVREQRRNGVSLLTRRLPNDEPAAAPPSATASRSFGVLVVAVDPSWARGGVGGALLDALEAEARARGFERMALTVHPANLGAIRFYERAGWSRSSTTSEWPGDMSKPLGGAPPPRALPPT